jgi:hypothetical protein
MGFRQAVKRTESEPTNPWIDRSSEAQAAPEQVIVVRPRSRPQRMAGIPEIQSTLDRRELTREERLVPVWLVAAHGGAGVSTIAGLMHRVGDAGGAWPIAGDDQQARVVLVARESWTGLGAARRALTEWVGGGVPVHLEGLLLIAARPGGPPKELRELAELVRSQANGAAWRLAWQRDWLIGQATMPSDNTLRDLHQQLFDDPPTNTRRE